jgi:hypothetical protein
MSPSWIMMFIEVLHIFRIFPLHKEYKLIYEREREREMNQEKNNKEREQLKIPLGERCYYRHGNFRDDSHWRKIHSL